MNYDVLFSLIAFTGAMIALRQASQYYLKNREKFVNCILLAVVIWFISIPPDIADASDFAIGWLGYGYMFVSHGIKKCSNLEKISGVKNLFPVFFVITSFFIAAYLVHNLDENLVIASRVIVVGLFGHIFTLFVINLIARKDLFSRGN